jgi:glycosyltransferase involved in cell wall biosynthesis
MDKQRPARPLLVVITPVYNESKIIERYAAEIGRVLFSSADLDVRVLFVDDGSSDDSWAAIQNLAQGSFRFSAIRLSRNFGAHTAITAGFDHVDGAADIVVTLACDLQDPPEVILSFVQKWRDGADIVWGARRSRMESRWRRGASHLVEFILRRFAMPAHSRFQTGSFLLIDRIVLDCVRQFREHARVTFALVAWTGFDQAVMEYDRRPRLEGRSGWTFTRLLSTAYDVFIGFSPLPAQLLTALGIVLLSGSLFVVIYLVMTWFLEDVQPGWTGLMATMTLCFGLLFVMLGISFEYLYRIFVETKERPLYFVSRRIGNARRRDTGNA